MQDEATEYKFRRCNCTRGRGGQWLLLLLDTREAARPQPLPTDPRLLYFKSTLLFCALY